MFGTAARTHAEAEWQLKPFVGVNFGGDTTFVTAARKTGVAFGASGTLIGEIFGVEGDFAHLPNVFTDVVESAPLILGSSATTLTGNVVAAMPRHLTQYTLRPYFVAGGGLMHVRIDSVLLPVSENLGAVDIGGGVTGFLSERIGLSWDVRRFYTVNGPSNTGLSIGPEHVSFWRATMAVAIRY